MSYIVTSYSIYLPVAVGLTVWVANTLHTNSKVFLVEIFHGQTELAVAVNKLLQVGFYLIALGFASIKLEIINTSVDGQITSVQEMIEILSYKIGGFILILGFMLFFNLILLLILRSGARPRSQNTFIPPQTFTAKG
ncbi:MAG: hypothetical protein V4608_03605 [Bacteroidota bacterium]